MEWNKENTTILIEHFKEKRELWDSTCADFKDRNKKHDAWKDLAEKLNREKSVVEKKMRSLIGQFQREYKNRRSGAGGEENISSKWFAFQLLLFLKDKNKVRCTNEAGTSENNPQEDSSVVNTQNCNSPKKKMKKTFDIEDAQKEAYGTMKELHSGFRSRDEFTVFGEHVAYRLRNLWDPYIVSTVQNQIHNIIFQAEIGLYCGGPSASHNSGNYTSSPQTNSSGPIGSPYADTDTSQFSENLDDILKYEYK